MAGILIAAGTYGLYHLPAGYAAILLIPMLLDGIIQLRTTYESTNWKRLLTGLLFGYAITTLLVTSLVATYWLGYHVVDPA